MNATLSLCHLRFLPNQSSRRSPLIHAHAHNHEIRVCTNRTCRRQGSFQTLETLNALAPPSITVNSSGCLGKCGSGPNLAVLPDGFLVRHCATPARAAELIVQLSAGISDSVAVSNTLEALALRKRAEFELEDANFSQADLLLSQAIELKPCGGIHIIFKDRSIVRLALGNHSAALEDANEALRVAPRYPEFLSFNREDVRKKGSNSRVDYLIVPKMYFPISLEGLHLPR